MCARAYLFCALVALVITIVVVFVVVAVGRGGGGGMFLTLVLSLRALELIFFLRACFWLLPSQSPLSSSSLSG